MVLKKEYQTVILAGLLHDIGKFLQKGDFKGPLKIAGKHPAVSANFIRSKAGVFEKVTDVGLLIELVQRHHEAAYFPPEFRVQYADSNMRPLAYLLSTADNYSSAERGDESGKYRDYKRVPLASVFSCLKLTRPTPDVKHYRLHPLNPANSFPESFQQLDLEQTNNYLKSFGRDFDRMAGCVNLSDFDCLYTHLVTLLLRYTWCIPSNTQEMIPDVSLYDHLRTTSAIAACLYSYHKGLSSLDERNVTDDKTNKFRLVVGDLSGIQNYIFDIANIGVGGVAKRLRARSFYLSALSEVISHNLIHKFNLPITNIIMSSGGKFYVLLPNLPGSCEEIEEFQSELDHWSVNNLSGEVIVNLAHVEFNGLAFNTFGKILGKLSEKLNQRKGSSLKGFLVHNEMWKTERFIMQSKGGEEDICQSCNKRVASYLDDGRNRLCDQCRRDLLIGTLLPQAAYLAFTRTKVSPKYRSSTFSLYGNYGFTIFDETPVAEFPAYLVYKLNETSLSEIADPPALPKFMANYIPLAGEENCIGCSGCSEEVRPSAGSPVYFDCIANRARGRKLLGYLKADVDNLGNLFVFGLREEHNDRSSISRMATLSRMLDLFFSGRIEQLLTIEFDSCYTIYSGGDDLLIVGPWNDLIEFAFLQPA